MVAICVVVRGDGRVFRRWCGGRPDVPMGGHGIGRVVWSIGGVLTGRNNATRYDVTG